MNENERAKSTCKEKIIIFIPVKHHHHQVVIKTEIVRLYQSIDVCVCESNHNRIKYFPTYWL